MIQNALRLSLLANISNVTGLELKTLGDRFLEFLPSFAQVIEPFVKRTVHELLDELQRLLLERRKADWPIVVGVLAAFSTVTDCLPIDSYLDLELARYVKYCRDTFLGMYAAGYGAYGSIYLRGESLGKVREAGLDNNEQEFLPSAGTVASRRRYVSTDIEIATVWLAYH